jgi:GTP-binding protein EngB required for normal cell division
VGSKFHVSKLRPEQISAYRKYEREKVEKHMDEYIQQCSKMKVCFNLYIVRSISELNSMDRAFIEALCPFQVKCEKLVTENDIVAKGIVELVSLHGVSKLIMGAAADKHYSRCAVKVHASAFTSTGYTVVDYKSY